MWNVIKNQKLPDKAEKNRKPKTKRQIVESQKTNNQNHDYHQENLKNIQTIEMKCDPIFQTQKTLIIVLMRFSCFSLDHMSTPIQT